MNPIEEYLINEGISIKQYAESAHLSRETIYKYLNGSVRPKKSNLKSLSRASKNKIPVQELRQFYYPETMAGAPC